MGEAILLNKPLTNISDYNWVYAFNNSDFIKYIAYNSYYNGYEEEISDYAYKNVTKFVSVQFPNCYKRIGSHAFENCTRLYSAIFPNGSYSTNADGIICNELGDYVFANCESLSTFSINTVRKIGKRAFYNCVNLRNINLSNAMMGNPSSTYWMNSIDDEAFMNCSNSGFSTYYMMYLERIGKRAFANCNFYSDIQIHIGRSICREVDDEAFLNCSTISAITLNDFPTGNSIPGINLRLGSEIFKGCTSLASIRMGCPTAIYSNTFGDDLRPVLKSLYCGLDTRVSTAPIYSDCYTEIGSHAFENYSQLQYVSIPYAKNIGDYAFAGCSKLLDVTIANYTSANIGDYAFAGCTSLTYIYGLGQYNSVGCSVGKQAFYGCSNITSIMAAFNHIGDEAFIGCTKLSSINIGTTLQSGCDVGANAFQGLNSLKQAIVKFNSVGSYAFAGCGNLSYLTGAPFVKYIGKYAFAACGALTSFVLCSTDISYIGDGAFAGCTSMSFLYLGNAKSVPVLVSTNAFGGWVSDYIIRVPSSLYDSFIADSVWGLISDHIVI